MQQKFSSPVAESIATLLTAFNLFKGYRTDQNPGLTEEQVYQLVEQDMDVFLSGTDEERATLKQRTERHFHK